MKSLAANLAASYNQKTQAKCLGFFLMFDGKSEVVVSDRVLFILAGLGLLAVSLCMTFTGEKDLTVDAWMYHYYSGSQLFDNRIGQDYFAASAQGYFNPLVHVPFAVMVWLDWPDYLIAAVLVGLCSLTFILLLLFYQKVLGLVRADLFVAMLLSLLSGIVWCAVGTSTADLYIQLLPLVALYCLFQGRDAHRAEMLYVSGLCWGMAAGLKLSVLIYAPAVASLLSYWVATGQHKGRVLLIVPCTVLLGFLLSFGWWGWQLYERFGNPFFPHFNTWFLSPDYTTQPLTDGRFLSVDGLKQALLPFRIALSEPFVYLEVLAPDLKPAIFVLATTVMLVRGLYRRTLSVGEEFVAFVFVSLWFWVFISGNGRYAILLFLLMGGAIFVLFKEFFSKKVSLILLCILIVLQGAVVSMVGNFNFGMKPWGTTWYNTKLQHRFDNQLVLRGGGNPLSAMFVRALGEGSSLSSPNTNYRFDLNESFQKLLEKYDGKIVGVFPLPEIIDTRAMSAETSRALLERMVFEDFGRFGLAYDAARSCSVANVIDDYGSLVGEFLVCHLVRDDKARLMYLAQTDAARRYFEKMEQACGELLAPTDNALSIHDGMIEKYYRGSEIQVFYKKSGILAKKYWSIRYFEMGDIESFDRLDGQAWRERYCMPLALSQALPAVD